MQEQLKMWEKEEVVNKGYRLNQHLLAPGERPDMRPWAGIFDKKEAKNDSHRN